jgi:hypothetical protein
VRYWFWAALLLACPAIASAQTAPDADAVIEGKRVPEKKRMRRQIDAITARVRDEKPLARFHDPICIATTGLPREMAIEVVNRMIEVAEQSGVPTGKEKCSPNIVLAFGDDAGAQIERLIQKDNAVLASLSVEEARALRREKGPAYFWGSSEVRSRDGDQLQYDGQGGPPTLKVSTASRISAPIRYDMRTAILVIEREALLGKSLRQIADYAAMRVFARTRQPSAPAFPTILSLFEPGAAAPSELTVFDRGYLQGLYQGQANAFAHTTQSQIAREIAEERAALTP